MSELHTLLTAWIGRALPQDAASVTRWFVISAEAMIDGQRTLLLRRVLGWDESTPPGWVTDSQEGRVTIHVEERPLGNALEILNALIGTSFTGEVRRVEAPVRDWYGLISAEMWSLLVPLVIYEVWAPSGVYEAAQPAWAQLTDAERQASGISDSGHVGSTVVLLPQKRPYFVSIESLVIPVSLETWGELHLVSEVLDGNVVISRSTGILHPETWRVREPSEASSHFNLRYVTDTFAAMNSLDLAAPADALARFPRDAHGRSGSDWRISVVGPRSCDVVQIGLIRGLGNNYFTSEPWRGRSPTIGFSAPARADYIPPTQDAARAAFSTLLRVGAPVWICDPYAEPASLASVASVLRGGRLLVRSKQINSNCITRAWATSQGVEVRVLSRLHDRFLVGPRHGFLIGTSLNGIGKGHSFIVELDTVMQMRVKEVFAELWADAQVPW